MLATIVVPLDGSDFSARAIPYATGLARSAGAKLAFLRVLPHRAPGNAVDELQAIQATLEMDANTARADGLQVDAIVRRIRPVQAQDVARTISRFADEQRAGLIVMSTHGRGGLGRWVYGSVADSVLRQSPTPVLLVPPRAERSLPADRRLRLLVPLDGSERAEEAIATAELLAQLLDAELTLLHVVEPPDYPLHGEGYAYVPWDQDAELSSARQYLQAHVDRLQAQGIMVSAQAATGKPTWVVAQVVRDVEPDIVMMATHGRSGLVRLVLGSVATSVLQQVDVPVLLVRPGALPRSDEAPSDAHERPDGAATVATATARSCPRVDVALSLTDLELIERGLRTLAYTPGYDDHLAPRIRELVGRLEGAGHGLETAEPARAPALTSKQ